MRQQYLNQATNLRQDSKYLPTTVLNVVNTSVFFYEFLLLMVLIDLTNSSQEEPTKVIVPKKAVVPTKAIVSKTNAFTKMMANAVGITMKNKVFSNNGFPAFKRILYTKIIVDGFKYAKKSLSSEYILTHFHSDHYTGLNSSFDAGTIYCTPGTAKLVARHLKVNTYTYTIVL